MHTYACGYMFTCACAGCINYTCACVCLQPAATRGRAGPAFGSRLGAGCWGVFLPSPSVGWGQQENPARTKKRGQEPAGPGRPVAGPETQPSLPACGMGGVAGALGGAAGQTPQLWLLFEKVPFSDPIMATIFFFTKCPLEWYSEAAGGWQALHGPQRVGGSPLQGCPVLARLGWRGLGFDVSIKKLSPGPCSGPTVHVTICVRPGEGALSERVVGAAFRAVPAPPPGGLADHAGSRCTCPPSASPPLL